MTSVRSKEKPHYNVADAPALFQKFVKDYNRVYNDDQDRQIHYEAFVKNLERINEMNSQDTAIYDINKFADNTDEERKKMFGLRKDKENKQ